MLRRVPWNIVISFSVGASLAGCVTAFKNACNRRWPDKLNGAKCKSYGAQPGTQRYIQCRAQVDTARTQAAATIGAAEQYCP